MTTLEDPHQIEIVVDTEHSHYHGPAWYGWSTRDNCYIAICPAFRHVSAHGDTELEALDELRIVLAGVLETYQSENWELPTSI